MKDPCDLCPIGPKDKCGHENCFVLRRPDDAPAETDEIDATDDEEDEE